MTATCLNGDCLKLMKDLPDKSVDLFVCDLPYGCFKKECKWDEKIDLAEFWNQVKRLCKNDNTPVLMFCNTKFGVDLITSNPSWFRYDLVWNKNRGTHFLNANKNPMTSHEMIYVFSKKGSFYKLIKEDSPNKGYSRKPFITKSGVWEGKQQISVPVEDNKRCPLSVISPLCIGRYNTKKDKGHPTAKPIEVMKWLIERYSNEADTVLDPTAGSFNSGRAAVELGRNYIGIEMDANFYEKNKL